MRKLVIKLTSGTESPERASQAFTVASAALAAGAEVSVWLTGEAVWFAVPGHAEQLILSHAPETAALRDAIVERGQLTVCTQCASRRVLTAADFVDGTRVAGAASFVEEILADGVQALVY